MKQLKNAILKTAAVAAVMSLAGVAAAQDWAEHTDFQKRLPGYKMDMMEADNSGKVNADVQFIADRQAILNHVSAYSYLIDEQRWDAWFDLFSDDVLFESTVPCIGHTKVRGKEAFMALTNLRYRGPGSNKNTTMRRHFQSNQHIAEQTDSTAQVRTYMLISAAFEDGAFKPITSGTYNLGLEKRDGAWIITRFAIETDVPVRNSPLPKNMPEGVIEAKIHECSE